LHLLIRSDCDCFPIISAYHVNGISGGQKDGNANFHSLVFGGNSSRPSKLKNMRKFSIEGKKNLLHGKENAQKAINADEEDYTVANLVSQWTEKSNQETIF
jgi:hypothetical protein